MAKESSPSMPEIKYFVSYSRMDTEFVLKLVKDLRASNINLWLDQLDIPIGERWDDAIEKALNNCQGMIIVLSHKSVSSQNVKDEISFALETEKKLVPVRFQPCVIPYRLGRIQYSDFCGSYEVGFAQLLRTLSTDKLGEMTTHESDLIIGEPGNLSDKEIQSFPSSPSLPSDLTNTAFWRFKSLKVTLKDIPALLYILNLAGVLSCLAILKLVFKGDFQTLGIVLLILLSLYALLILIAQLTKAVKGFQRTGGIILLFFIISITFFFSMLLISSVFFEYPRPADHLLSSIGFEIDQTSRKGSFICTNLGTDDTLWTLRAKLVCDYEIFDNSIKISLKSGWLVKNTSTKNLPNEQITLDNIRPSLAAYTDITTGDWYYAVKGQRQYYNKLVHPTDTIQIKPNVFILPLKKQINIEDCWVVFSLFIVSNMAPIGEIPVRSYVDVF